MSIDHAAWGTEILLARMFYWGSASYRANYLDSTKARGWLGIEPLSMEDVTFVGSLVEESIRFTFQAVMQYHFEQVCLPGPNGIFDRLDDLPVWTWGPTLADIVRPREGRASPSELSRYPFSVYVRCTGSIDYGREMPYDYVPIIWDLEAGEAWRFSLPVGDVVFYDPNLTPIDANPSGGFVEIHWPLGIEGTNPPGYGTWDSSSNAWTLVGPSATGGPKGSPGDYPLVPWGAIWLGKVHCDFCFWADLVGRSAWPERRHWVPSKDLDGVLSLYAKVANLGGKPVLAAAEFRNYDEQGRFIDAARTPEVLIGFEETLVVTVGWVPGSPGRYRVVAFAPFDSDGNGIVEAQGAR